MGWDGRAGVTRAPASREQRAGIQRDRSGFRSAAGGSHQLLLEGQQSAALEAWWDGKTGEV